MPCFSSKDHGISSVQCFPKPLSGLDPLASARELHYVFWARDQPRFIFFYKMMGHMTSQHFKTYWNVIFEDGRCFKDETLFHWSFKLTQPKWKGRTFIRWKILVPLKKILTSSIVINRTGQNWTTCATFFLNLTTTAMYMICMEIFIW